VYGWLWRTFPGGLIGKLLCSLVLLAAAVAVLFLFVFPRVESLLPFQDVTVPGPGASDSPSSAGR
jgi:hypothetical protein